MADTQEAAAPELYRCYHCGLESAHSSFKYFDNKKADQPRYQCSHCHKFFTLGLHGRPQGKTYAKKRNEDPDELKCLSRQCRHCGVADNAVFKYYNNHNISQPRFKCLSCGKQFQMRVLGTGEERRLVHTSTAGQTRGPRRKKQGMPVPSDQQTFLQPPSGEDAEFGDFLEEELLAEENNEGSNDDALSSAVNVANGFPQTWSNEDALSSTANVTDALPQTWSGLVNFTEAGVRYNEAPYVAMVSDSTSEMVPESTSNNVEVMYGTLALENPAATGSEPAPWTQNDTSVDPCNGNCVDDVAACCGQMDIEMPIENSMEQIDTSVDPDDPYYPDDDAYSSYPDDEEAFDRQIEMEIAMSNYIPWNRH